jgi:hypothetical protein
VSSRDTWLTRRKEAPIVDKTKIPEIEENAKIQRRILLERQTPDLKYDADVIRENLIFPDFMAPDYETLLFDIINHVEEKEKRKIREDYSFRILPLNDKNIEIKDILKDVMQTLEIKKYQEKKEKEVVKLVDCYFINELGKKHVCIEVSHPKKGRRISMNDKNVPEPEVINEELTKKEMSPIVYLDNEKYEDKPIPLPKKVKPLPSIYSRKMKLMKEKEEKELEMNEKWFKLRTAQFAHDGSPRGPNVKVPAYLKTTFPEAEFNEDYIAIDKVTDKRIRTSSVSNRLYINAPSITEVRKSGQHNFLLNALDKRTTYEELMEKLNLMVTAELCDPLNKMLKIDPTVLDFGYIKTGVKHQMFLKIRNDDNLMNRVYIKPSSPFISIELFPVGKVNNIYFRFLLERQKKLKL